MSNHAIPHFLRLLESSLAKFKANSVVPVCMHGENVSRHQWRNWLVYFEKERHQTRTEDEKKIALQEEGAGQLLLILAHVPYTCTMWVTTCTTPLKEPIFPSIQNVIYLNSGCKTQNRVLFDLVAGAAGLGKLEQVRRRGGRPAQLAHVCQAGCTSRSLKKGGNT